MIARLPLRLAVFVGVAVVAAAALVSAQTLNITLGLWSVTATTQMAGPPPVDMSQLTPEQRARVEASMKSMVAPHIFKTCVTADKLKGNPFEERADASCKRSVTERSTTVYAVREECTSPDEGTTTSEARFTALSPTSVTGTVSMVRRLNGQPSKITTQLTGKYMTSACGDVK